MDRAAWLLVVILTVIAWWLVWLLCRPQPVVERPQAPINSYQVARV